MPNPYSEFPDFADLNDRKLTLLLLYQITELRAELRAVTSVTLSTSGKDVSSEEFGKFADQAQDDVLREIVEHAKYLSGPGQRPPLN